MATIKQQTAFDILPISEEEKRRYLDLVSKSVGGGGFYNQYQTFFQGLDRYQHNLLPPNVEHAGLTFITRPRLCLSKDSVRQLGEFQPLDTNNPSSMAFAIRCLLDTRFTKDNFKSAAACNFLNIHSPFFTPLINGLQGISGFPDPVIQTLTTDAGFHSEDQTFVTGYDQMFKSYDLSLTFKDIQNGPIAAIFFYWMLYMGYVAKGLMPAYQDDIDAQRMNYTVSIYRFVLDPSRKYVTKYAKATGCFPKSVPFGAMFNYAEAEVYNSDSGKFTIPFAVNRVEYNKYQILTDFNTLVNRYRPASKQIVDSASRIFSDIKPYHSALKYDSEEGVQREKGNAHSPFLNYLGVPWIDTSGGKIRLIFL